jgi:outer membrane protein assembly factor BamB
MRNKIKVYWIMFFLSIFICSCAPLQITPSQVHTLLPTHQIIGDNGLSVNILWKTNFTPIKYNVNSASDCVADNGILYVMGNLPGSETTRFYAFNGFDGKELWSRDGFGNYTYSNNALFIGVIDKVYAIDKNTGKELWSVNLPLSSKNITKLYYYHDMLFVSSIGIPFLILSPKDGTILQQFAQIDDFRRKYPETPFIPGYPFATITNNKVKILHLYANNGYIMGIYRFDSNSLLYSIENMMSNATLLGDKLIYFSKDNDLEIVDLSTGKPYKKGHITPPIDYMNYRDNPDIRYLGYYLCADPTTNVLYSILGDSQELLAFKVSGLENPLKE